MFIVLLPPFQEAQRNARRLDPRARMVSPVMKHIDRPQPATGLDGKFSLQYGAAAAMLYGRVGVDTFTDEPRFRRDVAALLPDNVETLDAAGVATLVNLIATA